MYEEVDAAENLLFLRINGPPVVTNGRLTHGINKS